MARTSGPRPRGLGRPGDTVRRLLQLRLLRHELRLDWVRHGDLEDLAAEHDEHTRADAEAGRASGR